MSDLPSDWPPDWPAPRVTMRDMFAALSIERAGLIRRHRDLVESGTRPAPDESILRRALALHRAERFILKCSPYIEQVNDLVRRLQTRGPRS
ncbi:hypothetical protein [Ancylobacter amanitiformis]|uniref:Uncharacterized protein n=1 Tax=Ancylobacter amanitiformis TaxID=217069 RepID=A0ABU0LQF3_9HYPH|nr:hypothetical protein [Ancylobacter amanitiformis]MDQ0510925.1 hypothetical protein [Ancylobacter amanitiformis]